MKETPDSQLQTKRCLLRPVCEADVPELHKALTYPDFTDYLLGLPPRDESETLARVQRDCQGWKEGSKFVFAAFCQESFVGITGLRPFGEKGTWNVGFLITPAQWGKGFAPEIAARIIDFGFQVLNVQKIRLGHAKANQRSQRVMEKLNLKRTGEGFFERDGVQIPEWVYEITSTEWTRRDFGEM